MNPTYLFFDTETSDLIKFKSPNSHPSQPWICQLAAVQTDHLGNKLNTLSVLVNSMGLPMSKGAQDTHHITTETCDRFGIHPGLAYETFLMILKSSDFLVAHNIQFDLRLIKIMARRLGDQAHEDMENVMVDVDCLCTMQSSTAYCALPYPSGRKGNKWPKLEELYFILFHELLFGAHDALVDVEATIKCFFELKAREVM